MRALIVQLAAVLLGGPNAPLPPDEGIIITIVEAGSGSALPAPDLITNIMKELTLQIVGQFFVRIRYCIELIL